MAGATRKRTARPGKAAPRRDATASARGRRFAVIASRFNQDIVDRLVAGATAALREAGARARDIDLFRCPGAMEIPGLATRLADTGVYDGIVTLGVVIRGGTPHFDLVVNEAAAGIGRLSGEGRVAVSFGVLACDTPAQALARSGARDNRGRDAALAAVEMAALYARILPGRNRRRAGGRS